MLGFERTGDGVGEGTAERSQEREWEPRACCAKARVGSTESSDVILEDFCFKLCLFYSEHMGILPVCVNCHVCLVSTEVQREE